MDDLRKEKRAPILLKVKYKSASVDEFIQQSGLDISRGGIFIKTKTPMEIGTVLKFEFQLSDGAPVIHGVGRVAWRRAADVATRDLPPGMGVKFIKLDPQSREIVDRTVSQRGAGPSRYDAGEEEPSGPLAMPKSPSVPTGQMRAPVVASPSVAPADPSAASRAAASALRPSTATLPLPTAAPTAVKSATGARPAPPGVFSAPSKPVSSPQPAPSAPARARDSASGRATVPSADPFADAEAPTSFFPKGPPSPPPAAEDSTQVRHVSEFLASVMSEAGATDQSIAAEAQAGAEKARRREHEVEEQRLGALEAQLFGDMGEPTVSVPLRPVSLSAKAAVEKDKSFDPFAPDPASASPELAPTKSVKVPTAQPAMQASLAASKDAEAGRQQSFGATQASASEANFASPTAKPALSLPEQGFPSLPPAKKSSNAWLPLLVVGALLGGGAYWYLQLGGAQMIAGGATQPIAEDIAIDPTPTDPTLADPTEAEPVAADAVAADPLVPEPTVADPTPAVAAAMVDVQITATPKDALVSIDGVEQGKAPKRVSLAVGSTVNVTVNAFGYKPMTQSYTVLPKNDPLRFKLETMAFVLTVRTTPSDAHVIAGNAVGDNAQAMNLGFLSSPITVTVTKSGYTKKQQRVTPETFVEQNGTMTAGIDVGLRRAGAASNASDEPSDPGAAAPTPTNEPAPVAAPVVAAPVVRAPEPVATPEPEPTPAPRPAPTPKPEPAPALPDNPF